MRLALTFFLIFGVGGGAIFWFTWDYITRLRREIAYLRQQLRELQARNDDLVLVLEERSDAARIDEAIRRGHLPHDG